MEGFTSDFSTYAFVYEILFYQYQKFSLLTLDSPSQQKKTQGRSPDYFTMLPTNNEVAKNIFWSTVL